MYPAFLRGQAYVQVGDMHAAEIEFRKVIEQPGLTLNFSLGALARLELAKTYSMTGEIAKSKDAYQALAVIGRLSASATICGNLRGASEPVKRGAYVKKPPPACADGGLVSSI